MCSCPAHAEIINVPADQLDIQGAVLHASHGDTILIADGIYTGENNRDINFMGKDITISSASGDPELCIIDCQASETEYHRGFIFESGETNAARLSGLTIMNAFSAGGVSPPNGCGGGILCWGSSPTIDNLILRNNMASFGGGIAAFACSSSVSKCQFIENEIYFPYGESGGGYACGWSCQMTFSGCLFLRNRANLSGGALICMGGETIVERCDFIENTCVHRGGAIESTGGSHIYRYCTFARNLSVWVGGVFYIYVCEQFLIDHCTFVENQADLRGGGITWFGDSEDGPIDVRNSIFAFNSPDAVDCFDEDVEYIISCTDIYGHDSGNWIGCIADQYGLSGNISEDPLFCGSVNPLLPYSLSDESPCRPNAYPCMQIGSHGIGCGYSDVIEAVEPVFHIGDVYPNPASGLTTLRYFLSRSEPVQVHILDVTGRMVQTLKTGRTEGPGMSEVSWDGTGFEGHRQRTGIFFFNIRIGEVTEKRRIVLIR